MQCMEIWGGNEPARQSVSLAGLDAWVEAIPHASSAAGGDVHYLSSCATGRITRMFLADVSGHGSQVAEIARSLRSLMREHINFRDQLGFVKRMNKTFTEQSASGIFATALVCTYYAPRNELSLCNAGHPPPLWYRASTGRWQLLVADESQPREEPPGDDVGRNLPLGILDLADYEQFRVTLAPGDRVLCYTDSLIESRDETGEMLGPAGVLAIANGLPKEVPTDAFVTALWTALHERTGDTLLNDDVTMLLMTPNASTGHIGLRQWAIAPFNIFRNLITTRRDGTPRFARS